MEGRKWTFADVNNQTERSTGSRKFHIAPRLRVTDKVHVALKMASSGMLSSEKFDQRRMNPTVFAGRSGFSIVELLVVLATISILLGLLVPAVQYARESARRTQCISNLSQLGKAVHSFESQYGYLPPVRGYTVDRSSQETGSGHYRLLPWLDQSALYAQLDQKSREFYRIDKSEEISPEETPLPIFKCSSDASAFGTNNYTWSLGARIHNREPDELSGAFDARSDNGRPFLKEVNDGLSNTAAICERLRGSGDGAVFDRDRDIFFSGSELLIGLESADEMIPICEAATPSPGQFSPFSGRSWAFESYEATWYNHVIPPNSPLPYCTTFGADALKNHTGGAWRGIFEASSLHSGTVNLLLLDGSVRTISNSISLSTWQALGTKSGGD